MAPFQTSAEGIQDSDILPGLKAPYKGPARLVLVENRTIVSKKEEEFPNVLVFDFELQGTDVLGDDVSGRHQEKLEWPPRAEDDQKKTENKVARIGYIAKYFIGEEKAANLSGNTWEEFINNVVAAINQVDYKKKQINLKVPGQVYNGEPRLEIPNYKGFISDENSKVQVDFSDRELKENKEYLDAVAQKPTGNGTLEQEAADAAENPFKTDEAGF